MKRLLLIVLPLLLIVGCSKPIDNESLKDRNGVKYEQDSQSPYTGEVFELYDNGNKSLEGNYKDGLKNGIWTSWYENGQKEFEKDYTDGKPDGLMTYWDKNDGKMYKGNFLNFDDENIDYSTLDGSYIGYDKNTLGHVSFKNGKQNGLLTNWYKNGEKKEEGTFKDGERDGLRTYWYENGEKKEEIYTDGKQDGIQKNYNKRGLMTYECCYLDGIFVHPDSYIVKMRSRGNHDKLIPILRELISVKDVISPTLQYIIGDIYLNDLKDFENSLIEYKKVGEMFPGTPQEPESLFMIGYIYSNIIKDIDRGKEEYQSFLKRFPNHELTSSIKFELEFLGKDIKEIPPK